MYGYVLLQCYMFCVGSKQNVDQQTGPQDKGLRRDSDSDLSPERSGHKSQLMKWSC